MKVFAHIDGIGNRIVNYKPFENFSKKDLEELRKEISLNSLYISDYNNSKGIAPEYCSNFFDGYLDYICEMAGNDGITEENQGNSYLTTVFENYDNIENLVLFHKNEWNFENVEYSRDIWISKYCEWITVNFAA